MHGYYENIFDVVEGILEAGFFPDPFLLYCIISC